MGSLIPLQVEDLLLALGLIVLAIGLSAWQKLGLEGSLLLAAGRTGLQLTIVGYVLAIVFELNHPWPVLAVILLMLTIAAKVAHNRISSGIPHLLPLVWGAICVSTGLTLMYANLLIIRPEVWYDPQYLVPLAGIVLGNAMNGAALAGERLVSMISIRRLEIETHLSLGATPAVAMATYRQEAIRAGMLPTLNTMMVVGVVTLPGIITGQMLGGTKPLDAAAYQMVIMFMLAFVTLLTTLLVTTGICRQVFNPAAQLTF
ncbi:iron export ABC transporter permease subunit FetB [Leptolyngbya sp. 'hensonii']|uniref:ABC transporter permease n=1 Tax=Leptolyngbya sp. 'hensonii' TaxID=1922337 RepID=UPI00094FC72D|nr:iron export ABC transporter permease subunit FetB [Leptolyngbya sp. 'hensonii']OLP18985.1 iron export ABC transporter permease subunit FetB [Leptolyngbya sp. 'hensonii']